MAGPGSDSCRELANPTDVEHLVQNVQTSMSFLQGNVSSPSIEGDRNQVFQGCTFNVDMQHRSTADSPTGEEKREATEKKTQFVNQLTYKYKNLCKRVQPAPFLRDTYDIKDVFVQGEIKFLENRQGGALRDQENWIGLENYKLVFTDSRVKSKRRIIDGDPGYGKSTLALHMTHAWCHGVAPLKDFDILILLRLRQYKKAPTFYSAIKNLLLPKDSNLSEDDIKSILDSSSTLVVLDGYDEYPDRKKEDTDINLIIRGDMFQNHQIVLTTRTSCLPPVYTTDTTRLRLTGFGDKARDTYIRNIVQCSDDADKICRFLKETPVPADLSKIPLFFAMITYMVHKEQRFHNLKTVTEFFDHITTCMYRHDQIKAGCNKEIDIKETDHSGLSEIALEGLSRASQQLSWDSDELKNKLGQTAYEEYIRIGILIEEESYNYDSKKYEKVVTFYHKLFAEWFAAHSLVHKAVTSVTTLDKILSKVLNQATNRSLRRLLENLDPRDLHHLYRFACGLSRDVGRQIIEHLGENEHFDKYTLMCITEWGGSLETVLNTVRQLCSRLVRIGNEDSLLLQNSVVTLVTFASSRKIPIAWVFLSNCLSIDSTGNLRIQPSNLSLPVNGTSISELVIYEDGRVITEEETDSILQYAAKCRGLKNLEFIECLLPQYVKKTDSLSVLRSRKVTVVWSPGDGFYLLNLSSCRWEDIRFGSPMTDEQYQEERIKQQETDSSDSSE